MAGSKNHQVAGHTPAFVDWPTLALIVLFWIALVGVIVVNEHLPVWLVIGVLGVLGGLYPSLQHEVIHGHPTSSRSFNRVLVGAPLGLLQPFARYRAIHLAHHQSDLTDPIDDPESFYVLPDTWARANALQRLILRANRTLAARLTIGPFLAEWRMINIDVRRAARERGVATAWLTHIVGAGLVIVAVMRLGLPVWVYLVGFVFGGASLTALRSFVEHRAEASGSRSAVVHSGWFFSLIFLNNNLHYTHHRLPGAAWFRLPELSEVLDADDAAAAGAGCYNGYGSIFRKYLFRPFDQPVHPLASRMEV